MNMAIRQPARTKSRKAARSKKTKLLEHRPLLRLLVELRTERLRVMRSLLEDRLSLVRSEIKTLNEAFGSSDDNQDDDSDGDQDDDGDQNGDENDDDGNEDDDADDV